MENKILQNLDELIYNLPNQPTLKELELDALRRWGELIDAEEQGKDLIWTINEGIKIKES